MTCGPRQIQAACSRHAIAFTLVELLTVIAIIAVLAAILIPTVAGARIAANRARTRVQFAQWSGAIESFRDEYGCYPALDPTGKVNGGATPMPGGIHPFHDVLAGRRRDGSALPAAVSGLPADPPPPEGQNVRRIRFLTFTASELFPDSGGDEVVRNLVHDGFGNTDIAVLVDRNMDGVVNTADYPALPSVSPPDNDSLQFVPSEADFPAAASGGVRAGVLFYSCPPRATDASQLILSWK